MWKRLNSNQMCEKCSYKEVFLIKRFLIERFYCIYIYIYINLYKFIMYKNDNAYYKCINSIKTIYYKSNQIKYDNSYKINIFINF